MRRFLLHFLVRVLLLKAKRGERRRERKEERGERRGERKETREGQKEAKTSEWAKDKGIKGHSGEGVLSIKQCHPSFPLPFPFPFSFPFSSFFLFPFSFSSPPFLFPFAFEFQMDEIYDEESIAKNMRVIKRLLSFLHFNQKTNGKKERRKERKKGKEQSITQRTQAEHDGNGGGKRSRDLWFHCRQWLLVLLGCLPLPLPSPLGQDLLLSFFLLSLPHFPSFWWHFWRFDGSLLPLSPSPFPLLITIT